MQVVEYYKEYKGEEPFFMKGQKYVYCWGKYPNGSVDIAVYSYANDFAYDYNDFRSAMGINEITNNLQENMENSINEKVMQLKEIQAQLDSALAAYKESIAELEASKGNLVPEVMEAFKGQTQGAEKLKVAIDGIMVEITQESERLSTSYKDAFETALTKVNENTRKVLEQILEDSKVASKVKGQMKIDGSKVYEDMGDMFGKLKDWLSRAANKITGFSTKAEEGIGEIEAMLNNHEEEEANKYAASNMDDIEAGAIRETKNGEMNESEVIKNAATKHVLKGMGAEAPKNTVGTQPTTGGQVIKNAATKDMAKGKGETLKGEKSLEEPKKENGVVKNAATKDVEGGKTAGPASQNIEKQPTTGGQTIKNAATKDMSKTIKAAPAKAKVVAEDLDTNDGVNKMDEDNEVIKNAATKDIKGKTEVGGKTSGLKNMEEEKSELALRAGAKGKVYESEMEEEGWMNEEEMGMAENANANVAAEIAKRLGEIGIGGSEAALTAGLEAAMANPSPEAEAKAKELLGLPDAPVDQNPVFEDALPTANEFLAAMAGVISLFGLAFVLSYKEKIIETLKKTFGKGDDTVKEYGDEHSIPTDSAVKNMSASAPKEESWMNEEEDEKLNEAVNRMKQILKY
jgi:hypothetical protein